MKGFIITMHDKLHLASLNIDFLFTTLGITRKIASLHLKQLEEIGLLKGNK